MDKRERFMNIGRKLAALLVLLSLFIAPGCSFKDLDKRFFVIAAGVDLTGNSDAPYRVTLRLAIPYTKIESGEAHTEVESVESSSIAEGIRRLKSHVDKELDFAHCRVLLMGKPLVEQGISIPVEWMTRRRDIQQIAYVGVAVPDAHTLLNARIKSERYPGNAFFLTFGKEGTESSYTVTEHLFDLSRRLSEPGLDPFLPLVGSDGDSYVVEQVALFDKKKLRLLLSPEETQLYNIIANKFNKSGVAMNQNGQRLVMFNTNVNVHRTVKGGEAPVVKLRMKLRGMVEESPVRIQDERLHQTEKTLGGSISEQSIALLEKIRDAGIDPIGFGLAYRANRFGNPADWKRWQQTYRRLRFDVHTTVVFQNTGLTR